MTSKQKNTNLNNWLEIIDLKDQPEHLETLARWHHAQWSYLNPNSTLKQLIEEMETYLANNAVPSTFVALAKGQLAGSSAVITHDMDTHKELSPWLASVFIAPEFRKQGIGTRLVQHAMKFAKASGVETLYLFTDEQVQFYKNLGWTEFFQERYRAVDVTVMQVNLRLLNI